MRFTETQKDIFKIIVMGLFILILPFAACFYFKLFIDFVESAWRL